MPDLQESIHGSGVDDSETMGSVANWRISITLSNLETMNDQTLLQEALEEARKGLREGGATHWVGAG